MDSKIESDARPSIEAADLVLIPMAASHVDFWATGAIVEIAKKANKKILVQINRYNQRSKLIIKTNDFIIFVSVFFFFSDTSKFIITSFIFTLTTVSPSCGSYFVIPLNDFLRVGELELFTLFSSILGTNDIIGGCTIL